MHALFYCKNEGKKRPMTNENKCNVIRACIRVNVCTVHAFLPFILIFFTCHLIFRQQQQQTHLVIDTERRKKQDGKPLILLLKMERKAHRNQWKVQNQRHHLNIEAKKVHFMEFQAINGMILWGSELSIQMEITNSDFCLHCHRTNGF